MHFILAITDPLNLPDIIALQEIGSTEVHVDGRAHSVISQQLTDEIFRVTGTQYQYVDAAPIADSTGGAISLNIRPAFLLKQGINLISKAEIGAIEDAFIGNDELQYHASRKPLVINITKEGKALTLINCHLKSANARTNKEKKLAKKQRHRQAEIVQVFCQDQRDQSIIILGDLNDTPNSETLHKLTNERYISAWEKHEGRLYTTRHKTCPIVLDYILIDSHIAFHNPQSHHINTNITYPFKYSDHDPISVEIIL